jgi:adenylate cyclase
MAWLSSSIARRLLVAFVAIFAVTYITTAAVVFTSVEIAVAEAQGSALQSVADQRLSAIGDALNALATNLLAWARLDVMNDIPAGDIDKRIASSLEDLKSNYGLSGDIYVFDSEGVLVASSRLALESSSEPLPPSWQPGPDGLTFIDKTLNPFESEAGVALSLPVYASFAADFRLGTLVATVPWPSVAAYLTGDDSHAFLFNRGQRLITAAYALTDIPEGTIDAASLEERRLTLADGPHVAGYSTQTIALAPDWQVVVLRDLDTIDEPVDRVAFQLAKLGAALAIPIVLLIFWVSRRITNPIRELKTAVAGITSSGDLSERVSVHSRDELGALASAFNEMAGSLQVASGDRERALSDLEALNLSLEKRVAERTSDLESANKKLGNLSQQLSRYLSPQIYESIFQGKQTVEISTKRKELTVFFSDIKDFTATTEDLQPEELNALLNDYLTKMTEIALEHGATIDKYVGDAMLVFFGDPSTNGVEADAVACVKMAIAMQRRMVDLRAKWIDMGYSRPIHMRIGINTGYCNVGNFGSDLRMDYTIIGAEVNLAARLESICEPDGVMISGHTYQLVKNALDAEPQEPIQVKGISKPVTPYRVNGIFDDLDEGRTFIRSDTDDMRLFVDLRDLSDEQRQEIARELEAKAQLVRTKRPAG